MRRLLSLTAAVVIACSLAGCSGKKYGDELAGPERGNNGPASSANEAMPTPDVDELYPGPGLSDEGSADQDSPEGRAKSYLRSSNFSRDKLVSQLEFEGISKAEAEAAVDSLDVDWNEQALGWAQEYLEYSGASESGLRTQLTFEEFEPSEVDYAMANITADWDEQAVKVAKALMQSKSYTRQELIDQLLYEEFTQAQAEHGAKSVGL